MAYISIRDVYKSYGRTEVVHGIDLEIERDALTVLLGPSGCGKSTLLRMVAGLEDISSGEVEIDGKVVNELAPSERGCAMVFQNYALYPHQTVYKNMAFPLKMAGMRRDVIEQKVRAAAKTLELEALLDRLPRDLSGGERQRVAMGRAMIRQPKVYLFDEPLSNLDAELRVKMRLEISRMQKQLAATMVFVTHDQVEAMTLAHKIAVMREGRIEQHGMPLDVYDKPANRFVAGFLGSPAMNFLTVADATQNGAHMQLRLGGGAALDIPYILPQLPRTIGIRPEHVGCGADGLSFSGVNFEIVGVEHLGDRSYTHIATPMGELTLLGTEKSWPETSGRISAHGEKLHFFDETGSVINTPPGSA